MITDARRNGSAVKDGECFEEQSANDLDELAALAEEAEADAAEAHAVAVRARARAIRARQRVHTLETHGTLDELDAASDPVDVEARPRWFRRRPTRSAILRAAVVLIVVAAIAGSGLVLWQHQQVVNERHRAEEFTAAAREGVLALTSLDFARAQEDVQRVLDNATGAFKAEFQKRAEDFTKMVADSKVVARGSVYAMGVESMSKDSAVVLVAATSEVTGADGKKDEPRAWRLEVTVTRDGDQLKMSKVEFVQ